MSNSEQDCKYFLILASIRLVLFYANLSPRYLPIKVFAGGSSLHSSLLTYIQEIKLLTFLSAGCFPSFDTAICSFSSVPSLFFQDWHQDSVQYLYSPPAGPVCRGNPPDLLGLQSGSPSGRSCLPNTARHLCMAEHLISEAQPTLFALMG